MSYFHRLLTSEVLPTSPKKSKPMGGANALQGVPNKRVSREELLAMGEIALRARFEDATLIRKSPRDPNPLLREKDPGFIRDCAKAVGVQLKAGGLWKSKTEVCDEIPKAVETHINFPRWSELMSLPKDPPKGGGGKRCSVTGATSIVEIMKLFNGHTPSAPTFF